MGELDEFNNSILGKLGELNPRIWMLGVFDLKPCLVHKLVYLDNCVGNLVGLAGFVQSVSLFLYSFGLFLHLP